MENTNDILQNVKSPSTEDKEKVDIAIKMEASLDIMEDSCETGEDIVKREFKVETEEGSKEIESPWEPGQLVWARMSRYPFWPSIVSPDPNYKKIVMQRGWYHRLRGNHNIFITTNT